MAGVQEAVSQLGLVRTIDDPKLSVVRGALGLALARQEGSSGQADDSAGQDDEAVSSIGLVAAARGATAFSQRQEDEQSDDDDAPEQVPSSLPQTSQENTPSVSQAWGSFLKEYLLIWEGFFEEGIE